MKKLLLSLALFLALSTAQGQNLYNYGFSGVSADLATAGFTLTNQSTSASTILWRIAAFTSGTATATNGGTFQNQVYTTGQTYPVPNGQDGSPNSFAWVNFASTSSTAQTGATISNWLITPNITVKNGDVVTFYTRVGTYSADGTTPYADRLEFRMSTSGDFAVIPSSGPTDVGDFTNLLLTVNPDQVTTANSYPVTWTQYTATISGLTGETAVKFAFRYFVTDGGINGNRSNLIGVDTFSVDRPLATQDFATQNYGVYPNPADNVLNITSKNSTVLNKIQLTDVNGRIVKTVNGGAASAQINIADLNAGVYFVTISSDKGTGTTKIVKK